MTKILISSVVFFIAIAPAYAGKRRDFEYKTFPSAKKANCIQPDATQSDTESDSDLETSTRMFSPKDSLEDEADESEKWGESSFQEVAEIKHDVALLPPILSDVEISSKEMLNPSLPPFSVSSFEVSSKTILDARPLYSNPSAQVSMTAYEPKSIRTAILDVTVSCQDERERYIKSLENAVEALIIQLSILDDVEQFFLPVVNLKNTHALKVFIVKELLFKIVPGKNHEVWFPKPEEFRYSIIDAMALGYGRFLKPKNCHENNAFVFNQRPVSLAMIWNPPQPFYNMPTTQHVIEAHKLYVRLKSLYAKNKSVFDELERLWRS